MLSVVLLAALTACSDTVSPDMTRLEAPAAASRSVSAPAAGLVAAFGFNEASGSTAVDKSGNNNTGQLNSGVAHTTSGKFGSALSFASSYVTVPNASSLRLTTAMTLEAWVKPSSVSSAWRSVAYKGDDNYYLMATSTNGSRPAGGASFGNTSATTEAYGAAALAANTWTHLAVTYDGKTLRQYVNGNLVSSLAKTGTFTTSTNPLQIGGNQFYGQYFQGTIDEVRIYNRALSSSELLSDMNTPVDNGSTPAPAPITDTSAPAIRFTSHIHGTYATTASGLTLGGVASDNVGVTQVSWKNDRGGAGVASGTATWTASGVALQPGTNVITMTARDAASNLATSTLTVTRATTLQAPAPVPTPTQLAIVSQPATVLSGSTLGQVVVQLRDASSAPVSKAGVVVTASLASGSAALSGPLSMTTTANGTATFSSLVLTGSGAQTLRFSAPGLTATTSSVVSVTAPITGGFATPNVLNNASFETGWDGFTDWTGVGSPKAVTRDNTLSSNGTWSIRLNWVPNPNNDGGSQFLYRYGTADHIWMRFYFRLTAPVTTIMKFARFYDTDNSYAHGGLFLGKGDDIFTFGWDQENSAITTSIGLRQDQVIDGQWHSLEVEYWRNGDPSGYPSAAFWFDGAPVSPGNGAYTQYSCQAPGAPNGCNKSTWVNGRLNAGMRSSSRQLGNMEWLGTLNAGNTTTGQVNIDRVAYSTAGRIGQ